MYFGSVRFFKHLILGIIVVTITGLSVALAFSVINGGQLRARLNSLENELNIAQATIAQLSAQNQAEDGNGDLSPELDAEPIGYQQLYPELYCEPAAEYAADEGQSIYITIDDGPSRYTNEILDALAAQDIKATFFVVGYTIDSYPEQLRRIAAEGHQIGLHSYSHELDEIYVSVEDFLADFNEVYCKVRDIAGVEATVFRFPGGSINGYNSKTYQEIIAEMLRRGFTYYDWNVSAADASSSATFYSVQNTILSTYGNFQHSILLMHEKSFAADIINSVVPHMRESGYEFRVVTNDVKPIVFGYPK